MVEYWFTSTFASARVVAYSAPRPSGVATCAPGVGGAAVVTPELTALLALSSTPVVPSITLLMAAVPPTVMLDVPVDCE